MYLVHFVHMQIVTTTNARKNMSRIIDRVKFGGEVFGIGRRHSLDAILIQFPHQYNKDLHEITNINTASKSFDFLHEEPELYVMADLKKKYA